MQRLRNIFILLFLCLVLVGCDQVTKSLAKKHLMGREPITYLNNMVRLVYAENTGAFLSMGDDWSATTSFWIFTFLPLAVLVSLFVMAFKKKNQLSPWELLALLLIVSGGIGNIIDRIAHDRHVTDFINLGIGSLRTGIFNVADMYVTAGAVLMLTFSLFKKRSPNGTTPPPES
jgi:signal peptidase II